MNRRRFLGWVGKGVVGAIAAGCLLVKAEEKPRCIAKREDTWDNGTFSRTYYYNDYETRTAWYGKDGQCSRITKGHFEQRGSI